MNRNGSSDFEHPLLALDQGIWLDHRERVRKSAVGVSVAAIAVPLILAEWAPSAFIVVWFSAYLSMSIFFMVILWNGYGPGPLVEQWWSLSSSLAISAVLVSAVVHSDGLVDFWAAVVVALAYLTFEVASMPFREVAEWRLGFVVTAISLVITGLAAVHPVIALTFIPLTWSFIDGVGRVRGLKQAIEAQLAQVNQMAVHDDLTGLLNRRGVQAELQRVSQGATTVVMLDADRFKQINDTHGYSVGDQVLKQVAKTLKQRLPEAFKIGRQGGDEFIAIAATTVGLDDSVFEPIDCTVEWLDQPLELTVGISVGITHGRPNLGPDRLLQEAAFALRESKRTSSTVSSFEGALRARFERSLEIAAMTAADPSEDPGQGELVPVGHPIVSGERTVGVEILIRWQRPDGTILAPDDFLPMAVQNGTMPAINEMMIEHAVRFASRFNHLPVAPFISANVTASHLTSPGFGDYLKTLLDKHRVDPGRLMIEITESEYVGRGRGWEQVAVELRKAGIMLAIDDFGSGYSSIERLRRLPISHIKFDRSMVRSTSGPFGEIARGVTRFSNASQIDVIAEGVETLDELESMRSLGITLYQGFLFGAPAELDEVEQQVSRELAKHGVRTMPKP